MHIISEFEGILWSRYLEAAFAFARLRSLELGAEMCMRFLIISSIGLSSFKVKATVMG
jgi:hypothetical protein